MQAKAIATAVARVRRVTRVARRKIGRAMPATKGPLTIKRSAGSERLVSVW